MKRWRKKQINRIIILSLVLSGLFVYAGVYGVLALQGWRRAMPAPWIFIVAGIAHAVLITAVCVSWFLTRCGIDRNGEYIYVGDHVYVYRSVKSQNIWCNGVVRIADMGSKKIYIWNALKSDLELHCSKELALNEDAMQMRRPHITRRYVSGVDQEVVIIDGVFMEEE